MTSGGAGPQGSGTAQPPRPPIRTPVELDLEARELQRTLDRSNSPLLRFHLLIAFLRRTATLPPLWTTSYYRMLYPLFSASARHEYVCWIDPAHWVAALDFLAVIRDHDWVRSDKTFQETHETTWKKCALSLGAMRAFRELHGLLLGHGWVRQDLDARQWSAVLNADAIGLDAFREYLEVLRHRDDAPSFLFRAFERWEHARTDGSMPGVIFLHGGEQDGTAPGLVLHPDISVRKSEHTRVHFRNPLDENNTETMRQLHECAAAATAMATETFRSNVPTFEWTVGFHEQQASYSGESMGLAVSLAMMHFLQMDMNRPRRWRLRPNLVCTGGVDATGKVYELPASVLRAKVETAFYSAADVLLLPAAHTEQARAIALPLLQRFPGRRLEIIGISRLDDCVAAPGVIRVEFRSIYQRASAFARAHSVLLLLLLVLLLASLGGYFWWKSIYGYPDLEFTMTGRIEENALVFNPHRSEDWQFRDFDRVVPAELPFGDLETGADATRNVYLWNMTPSDLPVLLGIEGPQADQWFISWRGGLQEVAATGSLRVMVKYVPTRAAARNQARLTVRDPESGTLLSELRLVGAAGSPQPGGYALAFDGIDDMLFFGEQAIAFARDEGTIEGWVRIDSDTCTLFSNTRNAPQAPAMANMALAFRNDTAYLSVGNNTSAIDLRRPIMGDGRWHHFAVVFSREKQLIRFQFDGEVQLEKREEFIIEWVNRPYVTFGAHNNEESVQAPMRGALDELRVWDHALAPDSVRANMRRKVNGLTPGLVGYWDFDVVSEVSAHNANERTQDGQLLGRPAYIRSSVPLRPHGADVRLVRGPGGGRAIELQSCR
ncbi:MAG: LamG domain-containing protein, partial [Bacteroidetes bacterium]|nr:LamG domain-containing protein [Bacteroidota bacterium]